MLIRMKAEDIIVDGEHISTTYKVLDRDLKVITEITTTTNVLEITISNEYISAQLYGEVIYNLTDESITSGLITVNGKAEDILDYYPPELFVDIKDKALHISYGKPRRYASLNNETLGINVELMDVATGITLHKYNVSNDLIVPLRVIPKYVTLIDIVSTLTLNGVKVSNASRKSIRIKSNLLTINNLEYTVNEPFIITVDTSSFGYIDFKHKELFYAKVFGVDEVYHCLPNAMNANELKCTIKNTLVKPFVLLKGIIGNTLIEEKIQISEKVVL